MKRIVAVIASGVLCVTLLSGCNEEKCNQEGSMKATAGKTYYCTDRNDGNGRRWYEN